MRNLQIKLTNNWNGEFPIKGNIKGKDVVLNKSNKSDMFRSNLPLGAILEGGQMQLVDQYGVEYFAYYYTKEVHGQTFKPKQVIIDDIKE